MKMAEWTDKADGTSSFSFREPRGSKFDGAQVVIAKGGTFDGSNKDIQLRMASGEVYFACGAHSQDQKLSKARALIAVYNAVAKVNPADQPVALFGAMNRWVPMEGFDTFFFGSLALRVASNQWILASARELTTRYLAVQDMPNGLSPVAQKMHAVTTAVDFLQRGLTPLIELAETFKGDAMISQELQNAQRQAVAAVAAEPRLVACKRNPNHGHHMSNAKCSTCG